MAVNFGVRNYTAPDTIRGSQAHNNRFNLRELGEITGGELGKRDRDIAYNRALGLVDDRTTLGEGVGQAWDWTKDMAQSGLDLVKPVAQELKDSSAELVKPLVDWAEPKLDSLNSELEYQIDPFHATDKRAEQYADEQGKKVWEDVGLPEPKTESEPVKSYEVGAELPMPPELASENVVQGEPTPPMTVETPKVDVAQTVAADTSVKGKDWGKLFQIDPARAKFEWEQEYQQGMLDKPRGSTGITGNKAADIAERQFDRKINIEIAKKSRELYKNIQEKGWKPTSPEYIAAYGDILDLNASKMKRSSTTELDDFIKKYSDERTAKLNDDKLALQTKQDLDKNERLAYEDATKNVSDVMGKAKDVGAQLSKVEPLMQEAAATGNIKALQSASKMLIQSLDNSAVMAGEIDMFSDQSLMGMLRALASRAITGSKFTKKDMQELWNVAKSISSGVNGWVDTKTVQAQDLYKARGGTDTSSGITETMSLYRSPDFASMPDFPDFLEEKVNGKTSAERSGAAYDAIEGPKEEDKLDDLDVGDF